ncbi:MAG: hypothetical protein ACREHV_10710, partial [Rhizomicrobium sp.]
GRSVTDMPARMFYALGAEKERLASEPASGFGLLMACCCGADVQYWQQLAPQVPREAAGFQWLPGNSGLVARVRHAAPGQRFLARRWIAASAHGGDIQDIRD